MGVFEKVSVVEQSSRQRDSLRMVFPGSFPPLLLSLLLFLPLLVSSKMDCSGMAGAMTMMIPTNQILGNVLMNSGPWCRQ